MCNSTVWREASLRPKFAMETRHLRALPCEEAEGEQMTTRIACKYCIATRGLKGSEIKNLPKTDEELFDHIEREHHIPVRRENETVAQCEARFAREQPDAGAPDCKCPKCIAIRRAGTTIRKLLGEEAEHGKRRSR